MRIAVPLVGEQFSNHFGQSTGFWIGELGREPATLIDCQSVTIPEGGGCGAIPAILAEAGVNVVIAGGIGAGAVANLKRFNIHAVVGVTPAFPRQLALDFLAGRLSTTGQSCAEHGTGHDHHHGHEHGSCHGQGAK